MVVWKTSSTGLASVALVVGALARGGLGSLVPRDYTTNATCREQYSWMDNAQGKSPCLVAAYLMGPCVGSNYTVKAIVDPNEKYNPANASNASSCYCSWAMYNLLSACIKCQGGQNGILSWIGWTDGCGNFVSDTQYYKPNAPPADNTTLPYWASVNPRTWKDQRWNEEDCRPFADGSRPDLVLGSTTTTATATPVPNPSSNIGAIAGGVVGGVVAVAIGVGIALFIFCRHKRRSPQNNGPKSSMMESHFGFQHGRSPSDFSTKSYGSGLGYSQLQHTSSPSGGNSSQFPYSPTTYHTRNGSIHSLGFDSAPGSISYAGTPPPIPQVMSTQPTVFPNRQAVIVPFTLQHNTSTSQDSSAHDRDRKRVDSPDSTGSSVDPAAPRPRINPPAYSENPHDRGDFSSHAHDQLSSVGGSTSIVTTPARRPHEKSPSVDSIGSSTSGGHWTSASLSGAADMLSQMDTASLPGPPPANPPYPGPGPSMVLQYRDEKRRPTVMNATSDDTDQGDRPPS